MRLGFDVSPLARPHPPGVVRATRGLVEALERRGRIEVVRLAPPPGARVAPWRHLALPREVARRSLAGLHSPVSSFAFLGRGARVATVHEVPWVRGVSENADARHRLWCALGPLAADAVLCPSDATRRAVAAASPLAVEKLHVAPWGVDPRFTRPREPGDDARLAALGLAPGTYVLAVGATRAKKNVTASLRALAHADPDVVLAVTGPCTSEFVAALARARSDASDVGDAAGASGELARRVRHLGVLDDEDLARVTRGALASVVLSDSEGFAFPVVEAQAAGTPVVVARASPQSETAGDAAIGVDPGDARAIADAWRRARDERAIWAERGRAHAARFTWDACAAIVERAWEELA